MKANKIIMACSMLALIAPMSACDGQKMGDKEAFNACWAMIKPLMEDYVYYKDKITDEKILDLQSLQPKPFDHKWKWNFSYKLRDGKIDHWFEATANSNDGKIVFCHAFMDGSEALIWAR